MSDKYKPCELYDHSIILLRSKVSPGEVYLDDLINREIVFNNNDFKLYIKNHAGDNLIKFGFLDDTQLTINNTWS
jgi:hypothetical protein